MKPENDIKHPIEILDKFETYPHLQKIVSYYLHSNRLKQIKRQGWLDNGIPFTKCESVADHTFGSTILAVFLREYVSPQVNLEKVMKMLLLHDIAEGEIGDITPKDVNRYWNKYQAELQFFIDHFISKEQKSQKSKKSQYCALFQEFEEADTPESQYAKFIDKFEMRLQAIIYQQQFLSADLKDFFLPEDFFRQFPKITLTKELQHLLTELGNIFNEIKVKKDA